MSNYISKINIDAIKSKVDAVRQEIGRTVIAKSPNMTACPLCSSQNLLDTVGNRSFNQRCAVCKGLYWIKSMEEIPVLARVHWVSDEGIAVTPGGKYYLGDGYMHIDPMYYELMTSVQEKGFLVVDGQEVQIVRINPWGSPSINRLRVVFRARGSKPDLEV